MVCIEISKSKLLAPAAFTQVLPLQKSTLETLHQLYLYTIRFLVFDSVSAFQQVSGFLSLSHFRTTYFIPPFSGGWLSMLVAAPELKAETRLSTVFKQTSCYLPCFSVNQIWSGLCQAPLGTYVRQRVYRSQRGPASNQKETHLKTLTRQVAA